MASVSILMKHPFHNEDLVNSPEFALLQNSKTGESAIWSGGKLRVMPKEDFAPLALLAIVIRNAPDGADLMKKVAEFLKTP